MTVSTTNVSVEYAGNDSTTAFPITFQFGVAADLSVVLINDSTAAKTAQSLTTHYTVSQSAGGTGTLTMLTAPASGYTLRIRRITAKTQPGSLRNMGSYYPETVEDMFDRIVRQVQEVEEAGERSLHVPFGSDVDTELPDPAALKAIGWDSMGTGLRNIDLGTSDATVFTPSGTGAVPRTVQDKLRDLVSVKDFDAVGDGVADDTAAIQAALDEGVPVFAPAGIYRVTSELVFKRGSRLLGMGNWSGVGSGNIDTGTSVIRYAGAGGTNSCVVRMATQPVGTEPTDPATRDLMNVALRDIVIDGGGLAEIGVYMVRAWSNNPIEFVTVTNTRKHGFLALLCWNGSPRNWHAYKNLGCGITLGKNVFGWSASNVDQSTCTSFFGYYSGYDFNTVAQNTFNETTAPADSYGIGVFDARALVLVNAQANECGGAGIYVENTHWPLTFVGGYAENNGKSSGSTAQWNIWIKGAAAGSSWGIQFDGMRLGTGSAVRLTGTAPSRDEMGVTFRRMPFIGTVKADWGAYRLVDCDRNAVFSTTAPNGFVGQVNGGRNLAIAGSAVFDAATGAINLLNKEGIVSAVNYIAVGTYEVVLSQTFSSPRYGVTYSGGDNRILGIGTIGVGSFRVFNRTTAGALTDGNSRITVNVTGYY